MSGKLFILKSLVSFAFVYVLLYIVLQSDRAPPKPDLLFVTIASSASDGLNRLIRSAEVYGIQLKVLGLDNWKKIKSKYVSKRVDKRYTKIFILREELRRYKHRPNLVLMFLDAYDIVFTTGADEILSIFTSLGAKIVFGAETNCWPNSKPRRLFRNLSGVYKCLNSGVIMGYAPELDTLLNTEVDFSRPFCNDQCFYYDVFMNESLRTNLRMKLDHKAQLVQSILGVHESEYMVQPTANDSDFWNVKIGYRPALIHGNSLSKGVLNQISNYVAKSYSKSEGCLSCKEGRINMEKLKPSQHPKIMVAIFIAVETKFFKEMISKFQRLAYPKERLIVRVYSKDVNKEKTIADWISKNKQDYLGLSMTKIEKNLTQVQVKHKAMRACAKLSCDAFFNLKGNVHLDNKNSLNLLVSYNRSVLAPMLKERNPLSTVGNFWGLVQKWNHPSEFKETTDFKEILFSKIKGIWNAAYISEAFLMRRSSLDAYLKKSKDGRGSEDDLVFSYHNRMQDRYMHVVNLDYYGYLTIPGPSDSRGLSTDIGEAERNPEDWKQKYLDPAYYEYLKHPHKAKICPDAFYFPVFRSIFVREIRDEVLESTLISAEEKSGIRKQKQVDDAHLQMIEQLPNLRFLVAKFIHPVVDVLTEGSVEKISKSKIVKKEKVKNVKNFYLKLPLNMGNTSAECVHYKSEKCANYKRRIGWTLLYLKDERRSVDNISKPECHHLDLLTTFDLHLS